MLQLLRIPKGYSLLKQCLDWLLILQFFLFLFSHNSIASAVYALKIWTASFTLIFHVTYSIQDLQNLLAKFIFSYSCNLCNFSVHHLAFLKKERNLPSAAFVTSLIIICISANCSNFLRMRNSHFTLEYLYS